ncbi:MULTISPECIES: class I adenylate-forming enzyme family protein [unclassified Achromobacter]|uniref:class I adenylate-forming enzyme family protein n=1 Tax=unclassified Achromobacter TaxID=2626865 RepID=UPI001E4972A7|nr:MULTISPECIES: class I adenylate-forming enzyme family protein [unclassified Achromobacter]
MSIRKNTVLTLLDEGQMKAFYADGHWRDDTIYTSALQHARSRPDRYAIRDGHQRLTYGELIAAADAFAARLAAAGLSAGERVGLWTCSRVETAIVWLACSRNGYTCCPSLHRDHTVEDIYTLMARVRASAFIGEAQWGADAQRHDIFARLAGLESLKLTVTLAPVGTAGNEDLVRGPASSASSAAAAASPASASTSSDAGAPSQDPNRVVYLAFTSGTTGAPKGVMHSDNTLLANARTIARDWHFGTDSVLYTMSPLSHNLGLGAMISAFASGSEVVVHDLPKGASLLDRLLQTDATFVFGVPTHAIDMLNELRRRGMKTVGRLQGFRVSGAAAPTSVVQGLLEHGVTPQSGYGMTEACSHHYTLPSDDASRIVGSSGRACDGYEVRIFSKDDADVELAPGEIGQIGGRGASLMLGYFDNQLATEESFNKSGWFMTGDLGRMDADGYLVITGRKKDLIIRGGHNIYPAKIEGLAMQHPAVARAAALPVPDDRLGEKLCLAVMFKAGGQCTPEEMLAHLDQAGLSRYDMPEYFVALPEIPLTASGKIYKRDLVEDVRTGKLQVTPVRYGVAA